MPRSLEAAYADLLWDATTARLALDRAQIALGGAKVVGNAREIGVLRRDRQMRSAEIDPTVAMTAPAVDIPPVDLRLRLNAELFDAATLRDEVALDLVDCLPGGVRRRHDRQPALPEACRASKNGIDTAPEPDRDLVSRARIDARLRHRVILAAERQTVLPPERAGFSTSLISKASGL